jgi:nucleotide-binding universal stress UspA family protein
MCIKLLCATDGSQSASKATDYAIDLARKMGAHLTFLTVEYVNTQTVTRSVVWGSDVLSTGVAKLQAELRIARDKAFAYGLEDVACPELKEMTSLK